MHGVSLAAKNEMLFQRGINFNDLPSWQKRGIGAWWVTSTVGMVNPRTQEMEMVERKNLHAEFDLPIGDHYSEFLYRRLACSEDAPPISKASESDD